MAGALIIVAVVALGAGVVGVVIGHADTSSSSAVSRDSGPGSAVLAASAATRGEAATWIAGQVAASAIVACDPAMCAVLQADGLPATRLLVLGTATADPLGSDVVVATPGAVGSAVIAGHIDSRAGPGVFFRLSSLRHGDLIYVRRADSTLAIFLVTVVRQFPKNSFPTSAVYGPTPDSELRLITCGGTFDYQAGSYLSNTVVYAVETS